MPKLPNSAATFPERRKAAIYAGIDVWQSRAARLLVILLLCVHPLYFTGEGYIRFTWHKFLFLAIFMGVILLAVLAIWIARITRKPMLLPQDRLYIVDLAILGFALVTLLSAIFSPFKEVADVWIGIPEPNGRYDGAVTQLLYVAIFFIVSRWYKPRTKDFMLFGISASLVALIGIFQFYGMDFFKLWPNDSLEYRVENFYDIFFRSTLGNVNIVSTYVCVAILLCGFLFIRMKSKWQPFWLAASALNFWLMELADADSGRIGVIVAMVLAIPFIVESMKTLGRTMILASSWIAVYTLQILIYNVLVLKARTIGSLVPFVLVTVALLAVGIVLAIRGKEIDPETPARWKLGVVLIGVCIVAGVAGAEILGRQDPESGNTNFVYEVREILHGNIQDEFGTNRVYIWRNALEVYPNYPMIGSGPDTFRHAFPEDAQFYYGEPYDKAHNEYLQILICQGIIGLICYLVFLGGVLLKSIPKVFKNPMVMAVLAAFVGYSAQAFFNISVPIASQMLWVLAGMLASKRFREMTPT